MKDEYIDISECNLRQLNDGDNFSFLGSNVVWNVFEVRYRSVVIDSGKTHREIFFDDYYKGKKYHNCQRGDGRVILKKYIIK
jgi:hypothetical protein